MVNFGKFLKTWSLRSNSVTRQVSFNRTKIGGNCQNSNGTFWVIFKQFAPAFYFWGVNFICILCCFCCSQLSSRLVDLCCKLHTLQYSPIITGHIIEFGWRTKSDGCKAVVSITLTYERQKWISMGIIQFATRVQLNCRYTKIDLFWGLY